MKFIDEAVIFAKAGDGGNGAVAWRREPHVPRGGPAGGDGGNGGDIILQADVNKSTLLDYKYSPHLRAEAGQNGMSKNMYGRAGVDRIARVPIGTVALDEDTGLILCDLTEDGEQAVICKGGSGGHGNSRFANASRQAPDFAKPGLPGEERKIRLTLKLMADVGLLGFPNAGKSTFLSTVSAARPKIADYPFTTLVPQLGVVESDGGSFVLADIPGLIEGASDGAGLGIRFLKHLERVRVILHLVEPPIPGTEPEGPSLPAPATEGPSVGGAEKQGTSRLLVRYAALRTELTRYSKELAETPEVIAISKLDIHEPDDPEIAAFLKAMERAGRQIFRISSSTGEGIKELVRELQARAHPAPEVVDAPYDPLKR